MDQNKSKSMRVLRLNNDYTNAQLEKQMRSSGAPKRKFLGLVLITVVIVLAVPTYGLIQSFSNLEKARITERKTIASSEAIKYQASSQAELIKNMHNSYYIEKFARSNYGYAKNGEKIFAMPSSSINSQVDTDDTNE